MPVVRTFMAANSTPMKTALVEVQPKPPDVTNIAKLVTTVNNVTTLVHQLPLPFISTAVLPPKPPPAIPMVGTRVPSTAVQVLKPPAAIAPAVVGSLIKPHLAIPPIATLSSLVQHIAKPGAIMPTLRGADINRIIPSFKLELQPVGRNMPESSDLLAVTTKKFEPYEHLTGISQERPEVVMLTNFLPLYNPPPTTMHHDADKYSYRAHQPTKTPAGEFFDAQCNIRTLRLHNVKQVLSRLKSHNAHFRHVAATRKSSFDTQLDELNAMANYLWTVMSMLERLKAQLDVRDNLHVVDPHEVLRHHVIHFSPVSAEGILRFLTPFVTTYFPPTYDVGKCLSLFGFTLDNTRHTYSSTKIWLQLLLEMKHVLRTHSLSLIDADPQLERQDNSPVKITQSTVKRFDYNSWLPTLPKLDELKNVQPKNISQAWSAIGSAYNKIYENNKFKTEEQRIAALINTISREYRYSIGLSKPAVQQALAGYYGYQVNQQDNLQFIDNVVGKFANNISDMPLISNRALTSIAQQQPADNVAVLPLESRYLEGDTGTLTPGSGYYVDPVLYTNGHTYDVSRLKTYQDQLQEAHKQFNTIVNGMNMLSSEIHDHYHEQSGMFETALNNPRSLFEEFRKYLMTSDGVSLLPDMKKDPLTIVFSYASTDVKLRSLLFMFLVTKMSRAYTHNISFFDSMMSQDNTATSDALVEQIIKELLTRPHATPAAIAAAKKPKAPLWTYMAHAQVNEYSFVNIESIRSALKKGTKLLSAVENMMSKVMAAFKQDNKAFNGAITRYGGHPDTVILMSVFDAVTSMINAFGNRHVTGLYVDKSVRSFVVNDRSIVHTKAVQDVNQRLSREVVLAQHCIFTVLNTLNKLAGSIGNVINYLNGPHSQQMLSKIHSLFDNPDMLHMLFSEQQIRLFASAVADLKSAFASHTRSGTQPGDIDGDGDFDADDEIKALDDAEIGHKIKSTIDSLFSMPEFTSSAAKSNKILTVGIPMGFTRHLEQKVDIKKLKRTSFDVKQNDIVSINVYKVDLQHPEICYYPQRFFFELSRFPVRNESLWKSTPGRTMHDIISRLPTRDSGQVYAGFGEQVQYHNASKGENLAMSSQDYAFLTAAQKEDIYKNHVMSYLLEVYLKIMTGNTVGDYHFDMIDPPPHVESDFVNLVTNHHVNYVVGVKQSIAQLGATIHNQGLFFGATMMNKGKPNGSVLSNDAAKASRGTLANSAGTSMVATSTALSHFSTPTKVAKSVEIQPQHTTEFGLSLMSSKELPLMIHTLGVINEFARMMTPMSDPISVSKKLIQPKQFDRVFNLLIEPAKFHIDYAKTVATPHGKQALELLYKKGDIVRMPGPTMLRMGSHSLTLDYKARERHPAEGDLVFEKYIVTIETIGEDQV